MKKEIIVNKNNIKDDEITFKSEIKNYIFINNNKILLKYHHNSYYFVHEEEIDEKFNVEPIIIKKIYEEDYPLISDKSLITKYYYLINTNIIIKDGVWIDIKDIKNVLNESMYNNPRVQDITLEIIEIIDYLLTNIKEFS